MKKISRLRVGQRLTLDKMLFDSSVVEVIDLSPMQMFVVVKDIAGNKWTLPSEKLTEHLK